MLKGIDISHHNGNIDFSKVKNEVDFIIIKLGNIGDKRKFWLDNKFEYYYNQCKTYKIPCGIYVYCYSNTPENAKIGGELVREYLKDKPLELPIYIDIEDEELAVETNKTISNIIIAFNSEIEKDCKWAGIYCNKYWLNNKMNKNEILDKYTNWIAYYPKAIDENKYLNDYDIWQCSENGKIDGINGTVDINIMYRNLIEEINGTRPIEEKIIKCSQNIKSLVDGLEELGINSSYTNRKFIAKVNGINNYLGTYTQNLYLLDLLKRGELKL